MSLTLLDISNNQPQALDFAALKASGIAGVIHKASQGTAFIDSYLAPRWGQLKSAGLARGVYHFAGLSDAVAEANHFLSVVAHLLEPGDLVALDIETGIGDLSGWALAWLTVVEKALGFKPLLYSYPAFIAASLQADQLAAYPLWLASWQQNEPAAPHPWSSIALWQDNANARYPGLPVVDADVFFGTLDQLRAHGKPAPVPPTPPVAPPTPQEYQDESYLEQVYAIINNVPVRSSTQRRAELRAFLQTHPA